MQPIQCNLGWTYNKYVYSFHSNGCAVYVYLQQISLSTSHSSQTSPVYMCDWICHIELTFILLYSSWLPNAVLLCTFIRGYVWYLSAFLSTMIIAYLSISSSSCEHALVEWILGSANSERMHQYPVQTLRCWGQISEEQNSVNSGQYLTNTFLPACISCYASMGQPSAHTAHLSSRLCIHSSYGMPQVVLMMFCCICDNC